MVGGGLFGGSGNPTININADSVEVNRHEEYLKKRLKINIKDNDLNVIDVAGGILIEMNIIENNFNVDEYNKNFESVIKILYNTPMPTYYNITVESFNNHLFNIKKEYDIQQRMMTNICIEGLSKGKNTDQKKPITKMFLEIDKILESDNKSPFSSKILDLNELLKEMFDLTTTSEDLIELKGDNITFKYPETIENSGTISDTYKENTIQQITKLMRKIGSKDNHDELREHISKKL